MLRLRALFRPVVFTRGYRSSLLSDDILEVDDTPVQDREVIKNVYVESPITAQRSEEDIQRFMNEHGITVSGKMPKPILGMDEVNGPETILTEFDRSKIATPTPIQSLCWPLAMSGQDMIGIAQTGSGKTLGYLLPAALHINKQPQSRLRGPTALVLAPTRELVQQISTVASRWLGSTMRIRHAAVYGGAGRFPQIEQLRRGAKLCVATPGRLTDLMQCDEATLENTSLLVLDEADRMLDMGFEPQIREIVQNMRKDRQTVMFSATWPKDVQHLAGSFMEPDATRINIGSTELCANRNVQQEFRFLDDDYAKKDALFNILSETINDKVLVFAATKRRVNALANELLRNGIQCVQSHGDLSQASRDRSLSLFKGRTNVLIATDVAARGLDVRDIKIVVNYDFPMTVEDYIHRIGRTGRINNEGKSISFFTAENASLAKGIITVLRQAEQKVPEELNIYTETAKPAQSFRSQPKRQTFSRISKASNWRNYARR